jgi:hypothetical protein
MNNDVTSEVVALLTAAIRSLGVSQNAGLSGPVTGQGTTPHTLLSAPPGGPLAALQTGLSLPQLATAQGRAQLYITHPDLVRQVESLLDETVENLGDQVDNLLVRVDEQESQSGPILELAKSLRDTVVVLENMASNILSKKEELRQDILRLQENIKFLR